MEYTIKVNIDADEVIEKLERIKELCTEINELQDNKLNVNLTVNNEADLSAIKSYINNENAKNATFDLDDDNNDIYGFRHAVYKPTDKPIYKLKLEEDGIYAIKPDGTKQKITD